MTPEQRAEALRLANSIGTGYPSYEELADASDMLRALVAQAGAQAEPVVAWAVYIGDEKMKSFDSLEQATEWAQFERYGGSGYVYHIRTLYAHPLAAIAKETP